MALTKTDLEKYLKEVTSHFMKNSKALPKEREDYLRENQYDTRYRLRHLDEKKYRLKVKAGFSFSSLGDKDQAKVWSYIFKNTDQMTIGHLAIDHFKRFQGKKNHSLIQYWPLLKTWASTIDNWAHGDMVCSVYCDMLSEDQAKVYPELLKWSKSKSYWKNRLAIISLLYYYNPKRTALPYKKVIALVEPHLAKDHYYLQKAIGWNLREVSRAYPKEYAKFMDKNVLKLSPTAFTTAVEKLSPAKKEPYKKLRKEARSKARA